MEGREAVLRLEGSEPLSGWREAFHAAGCRVTMGVRVRGLGGSGGGAGRLVVRVSESKGGDVGGEN